MPKELGKNVSKKITEMALTGQSTLKLADRKVSIKTFSLKAMWALVFAFSNLLNTAIADCDRFTASSMDFGSGEKANWRTDYPLSANVDDKPWLEFDFENEPEDYMNAVLSTVSPHFKGAANGKFVANGTEPWWIAPWMDYTTSGRERLIGLTRERGPHAGDLSPTSEDGYQVWAVGFYNAAGAAALGEIFSDVCQPSLPVQVRFPSHTVAVKFLFTDADPDKVTYLNNAPTYSAYIDPPDAPRNTQIEDRVKRDVRLLQVDIAVKDRRARSTDWVFGTFAWIGAPSGDALFNNLVPVSLQWGNDPEVYNQDIKQSWINENLNGTLFGWEARPTLGFNGRANGPADNIVSSCLSCHAASRTPRSSLGLLGRFDMSKIDDEQAVRKHVDTYFKNIKSAQIFTPDEQAVASLDYSLQLESGIYRMCLACRLGGLSGETPALCRSSGFYNRPNCTVATDAEDVVRSLSLTSNSDVQKDFLDEEKLVETIKNLSVLPPARQ